ncbi:hormone-sensitive lipase isoform X2 [Antechinus flavipes]|uniref:hormone-sensitive lipase isoform X2 n=1 Tax=Antechinus flavipes TaxID=38775 RepID=UPI0022362F48|nr:hormone-sensitive lipase isoform X2 [Antechinus flavipes]
MEAGPTRSPATSGEEGPGPQQGPAPEQGPRPQQGPASAQDPESQQETSLEQEPATENEPVDQQSSATEQTPIAQVGSATEQIPTAHLGPHAPEQISMTQLEPHAPEQISMTQLEPHAPEQIPVAQLEPHAPEQIPTAQLEPHAPEQIPTAQVGSHAPEQTPEQIPVAELGPHAPEQTPIEQLGPPAPEQTPIEQLGAHAPEQTPEQIPVAQLEPHAPEQIPAAQLEPPAPEQIPAAQLESPAPEQIPIAQLEPSAPEQIPAAQLEPHAPEQIPAAQLEPPAPEQTPAAQLEPPAPEQTPAAQLEPPAPEQTPAAQLEPPAPEQTPVAQLEPPAPEQTPVAQLEPHVLEQPPLSKLGPCASEQPPLSKLGQHAPEEATPALPGPHVPEQPPLSKLGQRASEQPPLAPLGSASEQKPSFQPESPSLPESALDRGTCLTPPHIHTFQYRSMMHLELKYLQDSASEPGFHQGSVSEKGPTSQLRAMAEEVPVPQPEAAFKSEPPAPPRPEPKPTGHPAPKSKQDSTSEQGPVIPAQLYPLWQRCISQDEAPSQQQHPRAQPEAGSEKGAMPQPSPGQPLVTEKESEGLGSRTKEEFPSSHHYLPHKVMSAAEGILGHDGKLHIHQSVHRDGASRLTHGMDLRAMTQSLVVLAEDNATYFASQGPGETARRLAVAFTGIREQAMGLEPALGQLLGVAHLFDLDPETPANGYRSLVHTARCCLAHLLHKARYVAGSRKSIFFRASHNLAELEAYLAALTQLRALAYYAQRLLAANRPGGLFFEGDGGLSADFLREYGTLHKGCFYGRCLGFQFTPAIRPFLQTISIGLVSFGEHYKRNESGIGVAASSLFTGGRFAIDPELRGAEFERITQNLDVHFWKAFWNVTEIEVLSSLANMVSATVRVCRALSLPPHPFEIPLASNPQLNVTISPPVAHTGPGPVLVRLISYDLREGQDSEELNILARAEGPRNLELRPRTHHAPRSKSLVIHIHGGGFVAQTSKSHEPYLKSWAQELGVPILSIDYSLAPEAPFPRALEECFYAYCWALKNCRLLGSTGERVCLAGDSAGGNLCFTVSLRAAAYGVRLPDGIMAAYPATMLQASASPSRLMSLMDPLLPLSVLSKCLSAYAGVEPEVQEDQEQQALGVMGLVKRDTALLLRDLRLGASSWLNTFLELGGRRGIDGPPSVTETMRRSVSEAALQETSDFSKESAKSLTLQDLSLVGGPTPPGLSSSDDTLNSPPEVSFFLPSSPDEEGTEEDDEEEGRDNQDHLASTFPEGFQPRRSSQGRANLSLQTSPIVKNPFMSPLLAHDSMLQTLPPVHIVACALDPMLDDSVMFARRLRGLGRPVSLRVVEDLPHGFLSLAALCRETRQATALCVERIRLILTPGSDMQTAPAPSKTRWPERSRPKHSPPGSTAGSVPGLRSPGLSQPQPSRHSGLGPARS